MKPNARMGYATANHPRNNQGEMSVRSKAVRELKVFTVALVYSEIFSTSSRPFRPGFQTDYFR